MVSPEEWQYCIGEHLGSEVSSVLTISAGAVVDVENALEIVLYIVKPMHCYTKRRLPVIPLLFGKSILYDFSGMVLA